MDRTGWIVIIACSLGLFVWFDTQKKSIEKKRKVAEQLVLQTALGSIDLLLKSKKSAGELKKSIAVKGGTTEAAIKVFENK